MSARDTRGITIVGGGLAGLSLGIGLRRRGIAVTLHEAGSYPRHRVCGEFIRGVRADTLRALGIEECFAQARAHRRTVWFGVSGKRVREATLPRPAMGLSRFQLDARMAALFENHGGTLHLRSRISPGPPGPEGWVWTVGRHTERRSRWIGLKAHFIRLSTQGDLEMHVGRRGYVGLAEVEDARVNVCGLFRTRAGIRGRGIALLFDYLDACGLASLAHRLRNAGPDRESFTGVSAFRLGSQRADGMGCVLGDAERMIPPFTGNGMSMAFEGAECALDPLTDFAGGALGWPACRQRIRSALAARFRSRVATSRMLHPWLIGGALPRLTIGLMRARLVPIGLLTRLVT